MRVLVTGSHGFIGKNLVHALREREDDVFEYDLKVGMDVLNPNQSFPGELDEIYHLACLTQMAAEKEPLKSRFMNAYTVKVMADLAERTGARLIYTSTASVYGQADLIPTPVTHKTNPLTAYARDKLRGEDFAKVAPNHAILRLSNVYGPYQTIDNPYCGVVGRFIEQYLSKKPLTIIGDGQQTRDFTFVFDVVRHLMNPELKGLYNCSRGKEVTIAQLAMEITTARKDFLEYEIIPARSVDTIERRCLIPDLNCPTDLNVGIDYTLQWMKSVRR